MTDDELDRHIRAIIAREGGWVDDPDDSGGPTNYGITLDTWRAYCLSQGMTEKFWGVDFLKSISPLGAERVYRWYFLTQGLAELIDEFNVPDELVPLVMDMRTLHSMEGCRKILRDAEKMRYGLDAICDGHSDDKAFIALSRIRYMLEVAEHSPKDRKYVRGWMHRALKAIGMWPPEQASDVREA